MPKIFIFILVIVFICGCKPDRNEHDNWETYGGTKKMMRYSTLQSVDTSNVQKLAVAWTYHTGDADTVANSQIQCNPIIIDGILYATTPTLKVIALDAATGKEKWVFDPQQDIPAAKSRFFSQNNSRGVTYWEDKDDKRIFYTAGSLLYALHAETGKPIKNFADNGSIDLHNDLGRDVKNLYVSSTTPGVIFKDMLIVGSRVDEGANAAPGYIRSYDVRTGKLRWIFHTIPQPGEFGYETWEDSIAWKRIGGTNSWGGMTLDEEKGILFAPTGSASYDFYGARRKGAGLFSNCLLALDAATGKRIWHFQFIHHDMWDWDTPTPPALVTIQKDGKKIEAVAQTTKQGFIYVFERSTGNPVYPIEEKPVDHISDLVGEKPFATQPIPQLPEPFSRQTLSATDINPYASDSSKLEIQEKLSRYRYGHIFIPPGKITSLEFPGLDGGGEWGGPAYDPGNGWLYVNANEMAWEVTMLDVKAPPASPENYLQAGERLYTNQCVACHGQDRKGVGSFPSLLNINSKYKQDQLLQLLETGRRMMPSFGHLAEQDRKAIVSWLTADKKSGAQNYIRPAIAVDSFLQLPYRANISKFLTKEGYPAISPPWGTLNAVDLNTGRIAWKIPFGEYAALKEKGIPATGTENYGGPVVTAGGLLFIAATPDKKIRAFNKHTGKLLWEAALPAAGFATPSVYTVNGKQFIVIACGGGKLNVKSGDAYVAFALP